MYLSRRIPLRTPRPTQMAKCVEHGQPGLTRRISALESVARSGYGRGTNPWGALEITAILNAVWGFVNRKCGETSARRGSSLALSKLYSLCSRCAFCRATYQSKGRQSVAVVVRASGSTGPNMRETGSKIGGKPQEKGLTRICLLLWSATSFSADCMQIERRVHSAPSRRGIPHPGGRIAGGRAKRLRHGGDGAYAN